MTRSSETHDTEHPILALRPGDAARALGISARKLWEITADESSGIPVIRFGRAVVYPIDDLRAWLTERIELAGGDR